MAILALTHTPILNSRAQVLLLPVNSAGILLDPVLMRTKTLFPDNHQRYYRACRDSSLQVGSCLLHKRTLERTGLAVSSNGKQPSYIANLIISDHPYHPARKRWLTAALADLQQQLMPLIRYQGIRRAALLARPLIHHNQQDDGSEVPNLVSSVPLDWHTDTLPLLTQQLHAFPKLRVDIHLPSSVAI